MRLPSHCTPNLECSDLSELLDWSDGFQSKEFLLTQASLLANNVASPKAVPSHSTPNKATALQIWSAPTCRSFQTYLTVLYLKRQSKSRVCLSNRVVALRRVVWYAKLLPPKLGQAPALQIKSPHSKFGVLRLVGAFRLIWRFSI